MKRKVKIFISYAHGNHKLASEFTEKFVEYISASKKYEYSVWRDVELLVGQNWTEQLHKKLLECHVGVLLISPSFLNSRYIKDTELPLLFNSNSLVIPIGLSKIDFINHDLLGLENFQIYLLNVSDFNVPKFYSELRSRRRNEFIEKLFIQLEQMLDDSNLF